MKVTEKMRLVRSVNYITDEIDAQEEQLKALEKINLREVIIMRNKKTMYIADLRLMRRNAMARIIEIDKEEKKQWENMRA